MYIHLCTYTNKCLFSCGLLFKRAIGAGGAMAICSGPPSSGGNSNFGSLTAIGGGSGAGTVISVIV